MKYYFVKYKGCWADEFMVEGADVMTEGTYKNLLLDLLLINYPAELSFGTNEWMDYSSAEEIMSDLKLTEISKEEYDIMKPYFIGHVGFFPTVWHDRFDNIYKATI